MFRRTLFPLGLLTLAFAAFAAGAWSAADGNDLAGVYFVAVAVVALRAQYRISAAGTA